MHNYSEFLKNLKNIDCEAFVNEPMDKHTSFKIGGAADLFFKIYTEEALMKILKLLKSFNISFFVLGNGTNLLVSDKGIRGAVLQLVGDFQEISVVGANQIKCGSGVMVSKLCIFAKEKSLTGAEFLWGIPGTVGGALYMNAGAFGSEMKDIVKSCTYLTASSEKIILENDRLGLSYRQSRFSVTDDIITSVTIELKNGDTNEINSKMIEILEKRKAKQPLNYPNAGSIFKRPEGHFAGALIENCNLKGKSIGGAMVSEKHAGFIVNTGNATCQSVMDLINFIKDEVYKKTNVPLECEVKFIGDFSK